MSEYTKNRIKTLTENLEIFKAAGLNWLERMDRKELEIVKKEANV